MKNQKQKTKIKFTLGCVFYETSSCCTISLNFKTAFLLLHDSSNSAVQYHQRYLHEKKNPAQNISWEI